jgi:methylmalonyl-CoA/ethylmalonyl-CoA epimerase
LTEGHPLEVLGKEGLSNAFLGNLIEVGIVTADHRRVMEGLVRLGIGPWRIHTFDSSTVGGRTYRGEAGEYVLRVCFADVSNVVWEIMEPVEGPSIIEEHPAEHGEGIHHVAFDCQGMPWEKRMAAFASRGFGLTQAGTLADGNSFAFFDTQVATGTTFETYLVPEEFVWPEPEEWFPGPPPAPKRLGGAAGEDVPTGEGTG